MYPAYNGEAFTKRGEKGAHSSHWSIENLEIQLSTCYYCPYSRAGKAASLGSNSLITILGSWLHILSHLFHEMASLLQQNSFLNLLSNLKLGSQRPLSI